MPAPQLDWIDKVNDPELVAFLQQYGTENYLSAEEINELRDFVNDLSVGKMDITSLINPFLNLKLIDKGSQIGIPNTGPGLEIMDIVRGFFDADTYWPAAYYLGGDPGLRSSWLPHEESISFAVVPPIPTPDPPDPAERNFSDDFSSIHFKIFNT